MKKRLEKTANIRKMRAFWEWPKWPQCKGSIPCKILILGHKINCLKHAKNVSTNTFQLFYAKRGSKKQLIFEKWEHFENGQKWPQCKGYSPCKILTLGQKIKLPKICKNVSTNTFKLFYAKNGSKKQVILKKWEHFENGQKWPQCKGYSPCKIFTLGQKIKLPKICKKRFYKYIKVVLSKNRLQKTAYIRKMRAFWKWPKMATMQRL